MRGLHRCGKTFWHARMVEGARTQTSLEIEDPGEGPAKVPALLQEPDFCQSTPTYRRFRLAVKNLGASSEAFWETN